MRKSIKLVILQNGIIKVILNLQAEKINQIKIRGYRIELEEVETAILRHNAIKEVSVIAKKTVEGSNYLVGYYVAKGNLTENELREFLESELPEYMVPAFLQPIECMPVTISGKINKRLLPEVEITDSKYIAPEGMNETKLARIWSDILEIEETAHQQKYRLFPSGRKFYQGNTTGFSN